MKTDLFTAIIAAIAGSLIAYFVTNLFIEPPQDVTYTTVDATVNANLPDPDPEVFNYRALNPTVEVYVGECDEYNEFGECIEAGPDSVELIDDENVTNTESANQENN